MNKGLEQQYSRKQEEYKSLQEEHSSLKNKVEVEHETKRQVAEVSKGSYSFMFFKCKSYFSDSFFLSYNIPVL